MEKLAALFDRVGGEQGVRNLVRSFYDRVLRDPELAPFFEDASIDRLYSMQYEFFAAALGGPVKRTPPIRFSRAILASRAGVSGAVGAQITTGMIRFGYLAVISSR